VATPTKIQRILSSGIRTGTLTASQAASIAQEMAALPTPEIEKVLINIVGQGVARVLLADLATLIDLTTPSSINGPSGAGKAQPPSSIIDTNRFEVLGEIGRGGMGVVYKAIDKKLDREVALKVLELGPSVSKNMIERFFREGKAVAKIEHRGIVRAFDFLKESQGLVLILELVEGMPLSDRIARQLLTEKETIALAIGVLDALGYAHANGVIHRDLKPQNILITPAGQPKIIDFGLAKQESDAALTRTGHFVGTPYYMAPEQVKGVKDIDGRADIYSLGIVLYQCLTGRVPFSKSSAIETFDSILNDSPLPPSTWEPISPPIDAIILKSIAKDRRHRFSDAHSFKAAFENPELVSVDSPSQNPEDTVRIRPRVRRESRRFQPIESKGLPMAPLALCLVLILGIIGFFIISKSPSPSVAPTPSKPVATVPKSPVVTIPPKIVVTVPPKPVPNVPDIKPPTKPHPTIKKDPPKDPPRKVPTLLPSTRKKIQSLISEAQSIFKGKGNLAKARKMLLEAANLNENGSAAAALLARLALAQNRLEDALKWAVWAHHRKSIPAHKLLLADTRAIMCASLNLSKYRVTLETIAEEGGLNESVGALTLRAALRITEGNIKGATEDIERLKVLRPNDFRVYILEAGRFQKAEDIPGSIPALEKAHELNNGEGRVIALASAYELAGQREKSKTLLKKATPTKNIRTLLGRFFLMEGKTQKASPLIFPPGEKPKPNNSATTTVTVSNPRTFLTSQGTLRLAIKRTTSGTGYRAVSDLVYRKVDIKGQIRDTRALCRLHQGKWKEVIRILKGANDNHHRALRALSYMLSNDPPNTEREMQVLSQTGQGAPVAHIFGLFNQHRGNFPLAIRHYQDAHKIAPKNARILAALAMATLNKPEECLKYAREAVRLDKKDAYNLAALGTVHLKNGNIKRARKVLLKSKLHTAEAIYNLSLICISKKDYNKAKLMLTQFIKQFPKSNLKPKVESLLKSMKSKAPPINFKPWRAGFTVDKAKPVGFEVGRYDCQINRKKRIVITVGHRIWGNGKINKVILKVKSSTGKTVTVYDQKPPKSKTGAQSLPWKTAKAVFPLSVLNPSGETKFYLDWTSPKGNQVFTGYPIITVSGIPNQKAHKRAVPIIVLPLDPIFGQPIGPFKNKP